LLNLTWVLLYPLASGVLLFPFSGFSVGAYVGHGVVVASGGGVFNVSYAPVCRFHSGGHWWLAYVANGSVYVRSDSGAEYLVGAGPPVCGSEGVYAGGRVFACGSVADSPPGVPVCLNGTRPAVVAGTPPRLVGGPVLYPVRGRVVAASGSPLAGVVATGTGMVYAVWGYDGALRYARYVPARPDRAVCVSGACAAEAGDTVYVMYKEYFKAYNGRLASWSLIDGRPVFVVDDGGTVYLVTVSDGVSAKELRAPCPDVSAADFLDGYVAVVCGRAAYVSTVSPPPVVNVSAPARVRAGGNVTATVEGSFQYAVVRLGDAARVLLTPGNVTLPAPAAPGVYTLNVTACNGLLCVSRSVPVAVEVRPASVRVLAPARAEPYTVIGVRVVYTSRGRPVNGTCVVRYPGGYTVAPANREVEVPFDPRVPAEAVTATCTAPGYETATNSTTVEAAKPFITVKTYYLGLGRLNLTLFNNFTNSPAKGYEMTVTVNGEVLHTGYTGVVNLSKGLNVIKVNVTYGGVPVESLTINATYHGTVFNVSGPYCVHLADVPVVKVVNKTVVKPVPRPVPVVKRVERLPAGLAVGLLLTGAGLGAAAATYAPGWLRRWRGGG